MFEPIGTPINMAIASRLLSRPFLSLLEILWLESVGTASPNQRKRASNHGVSVFANLKHYLVRLQHNLVYACTNLVAYSSKAKFSTRSLERGRLHGKLSAEMPLNSPTDWVTRFSVMLGNAYKF